MSSEGHWDCADAWADGQLDDPLDDLSDEQEENASAFLHMRVQPAHKARWSAAALAAKLGLSAWVRRALNAASKEKNLLPD